MEYIRGCLFEQLHNEYNIFYKQTQCVNDFLLNEVKNIKHKFILISHNSDGGVIDNTISKDYWLAAYSNLMPDNLVRWYAQNVKCTNDRIVSIPIGLENDKWYPKENKFQKTKDILLTPKNIKKLLYINHNIINNVKERMEPYKLFENKDWCTIVKGRNGKNFNEYLNNVYNHKFVLCPEGMGVDTHRLWECLYINTIPIVKRGINTNFYADLPICYVDKWSEINKEFLESEYIRITNNKYNLEKMDFLYWKNRILKELE